MSTMSLQDLSYISREDLAQRMRASHSSSNSSETTPGGLPVNIAVVDVRDSDHIGGHIRGSTWLPSHELDYKTPELLRIMKDKEVVVFHCALSQQRGPSAALRYLREKERLEGTGRTESKGVVEEKGQGMEKANGDGEEGGKRQKVVVLKGGFTEWQEKYGRDERLTEGWRKDIWEDGY